MSAAPNLALVVEEEVAEVGTLEAAGVSVEVIVTKAVSNQVETLVVIIAPYLLALQQGTYDITWSLAQPATEGWSISAITSINGQAPVRNDNNTWTLGNWANDTKAAQNFSYTITLQRTNSQGGTDSVTIDPVIENDPPGGISE